MDLRTSTRQPYPFLLFEFWQQSRNSCQTSLIQLWSLGHIALRQPFLFPPLCTAASCSEYLALGLAHRWQNLAVLSIQPQPLQSRQRTRVAETLRATSKTTFTMVMGRLALRCSELRTSSLLSTRTTSLGRGSHV